MSEHEDPLILWTERFLQDTLSPEERRALTERVARDPEARTIFENQVRLSLELAASLRPEDLADARRRAALVLAAGSDTRRRRVIESTGKQLGLRFGSTRFSKAMMAGAAALVVAAAGLVAVLMWPSRPEPVRSVSPETAGTSAKEPAPPEREPRRTSDEAPRLPEEEKRAPERLPRNEGEKPALPPERKIDPEEPKPTEAAKPKAVEEKPARDDGTAPRQAPVPATAVAAAVLQDAAGEVYVLSGNERRRAKPGDAVVAGGGLETVGPLSVATLQFPDSTWIQLWGDSALAKVADDVGKRAHLDRGMLSADAVKQPEGRPMVVTTPQGQLRVVGTAFRVAVAGGAQPSTRLDVTEGKVRITRASDGKAIEVSAGSYAVAAPGLELMPRLQQKLQGKPPPHPKVDPKKVDAAIERGIQWLAAQDLKPKPVSQIGELRYAELVLYTLLHAGVSPKHPSFQALLGTVLEQKLEITYNVALQAMILSELDAAKYQDRIAHCCQFLVDNQSGAGHWYYGTPTLPPDLPPSRDVITGKPPEKAGARTRPSRILQIRRRRDGQGLGDSSNSQYAALGLRACIEALVFPPRETLEAARKWWVQTQKPDGGWGYESGESLRDSYGSMTAGGLGSLILYKHCLGEDWRSDPTVNHAVRWMAANFEVKQNPLCKGAAERMQTFAYYYLYAVERAGVFSGLDKFGAHDWYREGANHLLAVQNGDGSWEQDGRLRENVAATCFAILFLKRATPTLLPVASTDAAVRREKR